MSMTYEVANDRKYYARMKLIDACMREGYVPSDSTAFIPGKRVYVGLERKVLTIIERDMCTREQIVKETSREEGVIKDVVKRLLRDKTVEEVRVSNASNFLRVSKS